MAWSPAATSRPPSAAARRPDSSPRLPSRSSARRSTTSTRGRLPVGRDGRTTRRYVPARARPTLSTAGVALPRIAAAPASSARSKGRVAGLEARGSVALVRALVLLVDDDEADVGERGEDREARADDDVDVAARIRRHSSARSPSPRPEWTTATRASRSARRRSTSGHREGDLGDEDEGRPAGARATRRWPRRRSPSCRRRSRHRGGAASGARLRWPSSAAADGAGLLDGQRRARGSAAAQPDRPRREWQARPLPDVDLDEAAPDEAGDRSVAVALRRAGAGDAAGLQRRRSRPARRAPPPAGVRAGVPRPAPRSRGSAPRSAVRGQPEPALEPRPGARRPTASSRASGGRSPRARGGAGSAPPGPPARRGRGRLAGPRSICSSRSPVRRASSCLRAARRRRPLRDEIEPLEQARREHRPDDDRRRRKVVVRDPAGEVERRAAAAAARRSGPERRSA